MKRVKQIILNNIPSEQKNMLKDYGISYVYHLGIQAPTGTRFSINGGQTLDIGNTGIFELELDAPYIYSLIFTKQSELSGKILVDVVYEAGE